MLRVLIVFLTMSLLLTSCDDGDDDSGTAGGSAEVKKTSSPAPTPTASPAPKPTADTSAPSNASTIYLSASRDFSCTNNWTTRDGALGLQAYSGSGSCTADFPGASGSYSITLTVQSERDGRPPYLVSINGQDVNGGRFPSAGGGCDCPMEQCPDRNQDIGIGTFSLKNGDQIGFWGQEDFACDGHGAYAKWHGMTFRRVD